MKPIAVDLTIPLDELDTQSLLSDWRWLVPSDYIPIQMNKFGWWFLANSVGHIFLLDHIEGGLQCIARSLTEFNEKKKNEDIQSDWFQDGFILRCHREGPILGPGQCYMWKIPPILGGKFQHENISVASLRVCQSLMGQLFRQIAEKGPGLNVTGFTLDKG